MLQSFAINLTKLQNFNIMEPQWWILELKARKFYFYSTIVILSSMKIPKNFIKKCKICYGNFQNVR